MDTVTDATRISSNDGKESSSPCVAFTDNFTLKDNIGKLSQPDNTINSDPKPKARKINRQYRINRAPKIDPKTTKFLSDKDKVLLCVMFIANNIVARQISGNIMNRIKGKISQAQYDNNFEEIKSEELRLMRSLPNILDRNEISSDSIGYDIIVEIIDLLAGISLKEKNANQKAKLQNKLVALISKNGVNLSHNDTLKDIKQQLLNLSPEERAMILVSLPL